MADSDEQIELNTTQARAGATPGMTRYILGISLPLVIIAFFLVWYLG